METISLSRLNEFVRRVIALNFDDPVWIVAELLQIKESKGHYYIELAEKSDQGDIIAQSSAVIWKPNYGLIKKSLSADIFTILKEGNQIKVQVLVDYHPRFGLKLNIQKVDESYTLGKILQQKIQTIDRLKKENLWQINRTLELPIIIQNLAVITSMTAAGKIDFENQLMSNPFGYQFKLSYYPAAMQGLQTETEVSQAIININEQEVAPFDGIVIVRGGGSKLDLMDFDTYQISKQIGLSALPVLIGVGHHIDESVADMNAFASLKTPTAVAEYIINHNRLAEENVIKTMERIRFYGSQIISTYAIELRHIKESLNTSFINIKYTEQQKIIRYKNKLYNLVQQFIQNKFTTLLQLDHKIKINDPSIFYQKGYSLLFQHEKPITSIHELDLSDPMITKLKDGSVLSQPIKIWQNQKSN